MSSVVKLELPPPLQVLESFLQLNQSILDALPIGIYVCDASGRIVRVNQRAIELWGRSPQLFDLTQLFCGSFRVETLDGQLVSPEQTPMARAVFTGESLTAVEAIVQNPDGKRWIARVNVAPLRDAAGAVSGAINCFQDVTSEHELRQRLESQQHVFDLAMVAAKMGTWRYTLADNVCVYDNNAQRLYGLTEASFLHDEAGVAAKFHPADMDLLWARVAQALDPQGDGRYEVEYRVKQTDGSWRWLSAWGLVEFEGRGAARKPVAISGASRDLTERKSAEELQNLLNNELNHRIKNTLATVQSIVSQTLRGAIDLEAARNSLDARIASLANAHDLLTRRNWTGADVSDLIARTLAPFPATQITTSGPSFDIAPKQVLALSLALHELATNATKYGALSQPEGRVELAWKINDGLLSLEWQESEGPHVSSPSRQGFGSRLLEALVSAELNGQSHLDFAPDGVCCRISIAID